MTSFQAVFLADFEQGLWSQKTASVPSSLPVNPFPGQDRSVFKVTRVILGTTPPGNLMLRHVSGRNAHQRLVEELVHSRKLKKKKFPKGETSQLCQFWHAGTMDYYCWGERRMASAIDGVTIGEPADSFGQAARHGRVTLCDSIVTKF